MGRPGQIKHEYLKSSVMTSSPEQLQLMLLDGAVSHTRLAVDAIDSANIEGSFNALDKAEQIVLALTAGLRRDVNPELVDRMLSLYNFVFRRLVDASMHRDRQAALDALKILEHQRQTWVLLMEKISSDQNMGRAPAEAQVGEHVPGISLEC